MEIHKIISLAKTNMINIDAIVRLVIIAFFFKECFLMEVSFLALQSTGASNIYNTHNNI